MAALILALNPGAASADADGPDFFEARNVAKNDVLNIRAEPNPRAAKVGKIPPDGTCIRNLGCRGGLTFREFNELSPSERKRRERERWWLRTANAGAASSLAPGQGKLDQ